MSDSDNETQDQRAALGPEPALPPTEDMAEAPVRETAQTVGPAREVEETMAAPVMQAPASANVGAPAPGLGLGTAPIGPAAPQAYGRPYRSDVGRERGGDGHRRVCGFCMDNIKDIDYKDTARLRRFLSERGKIEPRRKTGTCARHQRSLTVALKRARQLALLPYTAEHVQFMGR